MKKIEWILLFLTIFGSILYSSVDLTNGLVAHYEFEGNAKDSSGNGNDGVEHGGIGYSDGVIGQAGSFDGVDDYIRLANKNLNSLKEFTISLYLLPIGNGGAIFNSYSWNGSSGRGFSLTLNDEVGSGVPEGTGKDFLWFGSLFDEGWFGNQSKFIKTKLERYKFLHVCAVYKDGKEQLYIDGQLKAFHIVDHKFDLGNYDFLIGTYAFNNATNTVANANGRAFKGQMDELRFYNRALNEEEIAELYNIKDSRNEEDKSVKYDFNGDGLADILWKKGDGYALWYMSESGKHKYKYIGRKEGYTIAGIADFNGDKISDILWKKGDGNYIWYMKANGKHRYKNIGKKRGYAVAEIADFNGDGIADILWRKGSGNHIWYMKANGKHRYKNIGRKSTSYSIQF